MTARRCIGGRNTATTVGGWLLVALLAACDSRGRGGDAAVGEVGEAGGGDAAVDTASEAGRDGGAPELGPPGAWVYAGGSQRIDLFAADLSTGSLTLRQTVAAGDDARLAELDPGGQRLYVQS